MVKRKSPKTPPNKPAKKARKATRKAAASAPATDPTSDEALLALPQSYAEAPDIPVEIARRELSSLARLATRCEADLRKIGIGPQAVELAARFATVLGRKQSAWEKARKGAVLTAVERKLLTEAEALDAKLVAAGRWALRRDPTAQAELSRIAEGAGLTDTLQDLRDLRVFWREHAAHIGTTLITDKDLARAGVLVEKLEAAAEKESAHVDAAEAQDLRNRAFWAAHQLAQDIREGGRYVYANNPKMAAKFTSRHRAATVKRARKQKARGSGAAAEAAAPSPATA